ncbi:BTB/POZ domain [Trinorchestia longiramus]|nr:BTB/POZ domain [Trinorchestia longiramus]
MCSEPRATRLVAEGRPVCRVVAFLPCTQRGGGLSPSSSLPLPAQSPCFPPSLTPPFIPVSVRALACLFSPAIMMLPLLPQTAFSCFFLGRRRALWCWTFELSWVLNFKMVTAEPQLHLRWHSHSSTFTTMLADLHDRAAFSDLTIVCEDGQVKAHKAILSLCSPYLSKLLSDKGGDLDVQTSSPACSSSSSSSGSGSCNATTLILPEIPVMDIMYLVSFIYCGQVDVSQAHIASFLNTGKHLHVLGLEQGDRLVESPEPSEEAGSWCGGDVASEDDTVTSSSLPLSRSSTPHSGLSSAPPNDALPQQALQQQPAPQDGGQQQFTLQQQHLQSIHLSQQQQLGSQVMRLTPQSQLKQRQQFQQQTSNTSTQKGTNQTESSGGRLSDVNANLTPKKMKDTAGGGKQTVTQSATMSNGLALKQETADDERECLLNPHISIKEERMSERDEDEEKHMLDLKHSVFSSVGANPSNLGAASGFLPQELNSAATTLPNSSSSSNSSCSSSTDSAVAAAAALASIASMGGENAMMNGATDGSFGPGDGAITPTNISGIIGSDGRIDLNFYLQQAIQYASMPCPLCKKEFKSQSGLRDHIRLHTGERPFICDFCHMNFARASHLKRHRRMHTGEKPFDCRVCGKDFSRGDKLKDHLKRHEADEKLNKIRKQLLNPEECANPVAGDGSSGASGDSASVGLSSSKQLISNGDLSSASLVASTASMVVKLASTAAAAASTASSAAGAVGDSLNNLGERVANLTARANPQAVTPDSVMSAKTSVTVAAAIQQQRLQQMQQQTLLQQQMIRRPTSAVALTLQPSKKRKLVSSSAPSHLPNLSSSASHPLFTSSSFSDLVNVASAINSSSIVSQMNSNSNSSSSPSSTLLNLMTSNANNSIMFPNPSTSISAASDINSSGSGGTNAAVAGVIPQMLAMANIGECVLKPIN